MTDGYSAFEPLVWGLFGGFVVLVVAVERIFRARHPDYPGVPDKREERVNQ